MDEINVKYMLCFKIMILFLSYISTYIKTLHINVKNNMCHFKLDFLANSKWSGRKTVY